MSDLDVWGEPIQESANYFAEDEDPDPDGVRRGSRVSIWHTGSDGTEFDVYGETIEDARKNARYLMKALEEKLAGKTITEETYLLPDDIIRDPRGRHPFAEDRGLFDGWQIKVKR